MTGSRDADVLQRLATAEQKLVTVQRQREDDHRELQELKELANKGRGALWMLVKIGTVAGAIVGLAVAVWRYLHGGP